MTSKLPRARLLAAVAVAFVCGLLFASGFDLTRYGWAQTKLPPKPSAAQVQTLAETQNAFEAVADHVTPAVVSIHTERFARTRPNSRLRGQRQPDGIEQFFRQFDMPPADQPSEASGSGFIVSKDGYILTNNHVVADADRVTVQLLDNRTFTAKVIGRDPTTDVAVIKVDASDLPTVSLGDDVNAKVGQWVLAIGNPLGLDFTVTAGIVSARGRTLLGLARERYAIQDYIQTDAAINPGNSGGPLVNIRGEVIGINSAIASNTGYYAGYGFAIPITLAKQVMDDIIQYGKVQRAVLGININEVEPNDAQVAGLKEIRGAKVSGFDPDPDNSPAKKAGLEVGDIIIAVNGTPIDRVSSLQREIRRYKPGQTVTIDVMRFGEKKSLAVKLGAPPADESTDVASRDQAGSASPTANAASRSYERLGISVQPLPPAVAEQRNVDAAYRSGLLVTDVNAAGPAYSELQEGADVIVRVLYPVKKDIRSVSDFQDIVSKLKSGDLITLMVLNTAPGGATRAVTLKAQ
ncbi:MAG TPA: Do family serine endopeptidase [Gemmatimonadaceae bacterium]|nr:Do family serine endopeptidase [Gemmatimonadaceae bacterium]